MEKLKATIVKITKENVEFDLPAFFSDDSGHNFYKVDTVDSFCQVTLDPFETGIKNLRIPVCKKVIAQKQITEEVFNNAYHKAVTKIAFATNVKTLYSQN